MINEDDIFLTASEAMRILRLKRSTFYSYVVQGIVPSFRVGKFLRFRREDILHFGR